MLKMIFYIVFSTFVLAGCNNNIKTNLETSWITVVSPYLLYTDPGSITGTINLYVTPLDVEVLENYNGSQEDLAVKIEGSNLIYTFNPTGQSKPKLLDKFEFDGHPLFYHRAVFRVKILGSGSEEINKHIEKQEHISFQNNELKYNEVTLLLNDFYTGEFTNPSFVFNGELDELGSFLSILNSVFTSNASLWKQEYFESNPDFVEKVKEITKDAVTDKEIAKNIVKWVYANIRPLSNQEMKVATDTSTLEGQRRTSANYVWEERKGYCKNTAFLIKAMLEVEGIKNRFVLGYIPDGTGHVMNSIYDASQERWIWLDGTTGGIDDPRMYQAFEKSQIVSNNKKTR